jgi:hypothetical protein
MTTHGRAVLLGTIGAMFLLFIRALLRGDDTAGAIAALERHWRRSLDALANLSMGVES